MMSSLPGRHPIVDFNSYPIPSSTCSFLISRYFHSDSVSFAISMTLFIMTIFSNLHSFFPLSDRFCINKSSKAVLPASWSTKDRGMPAGLRCRRRYESGGSTNSGSSSVGNPS